MTATTFNIPDISSNPQPVTVNANGREDAAGSKPVVLATEDKAALDSIITQTGLTANALAAVTDEDDSVKIAFYYNGVAVDPTAAGPVIGGTAADAALAFAPVTTGGLAKTTNPTAVADGDVVNARFSKVGDQIVRGIPRELIAKQRTVITSSISEVTVLTAGSAGVLHDVYFVIITNTSATATEVDFKDATAGTTQFTLSAPAGQSSGYAIDAGCGWPQSAAAQNWTATCADSVASIIISILAAKSI